MPYILWMPLLPFKAESVSQFPTTPQFKFLNFEYICRKRSNFLLKDQGNFQTFMINPLRINLELSFKNRMIGFDSKGCKDKNRFYPDIDVVSLFSFKSKARWNKMVKYGFIYSIYFFDYIFSTFGVIKRNSAIFINQINSEKRLQLFQESECIVNILILEGTVA